MAMIAVAATATTVLRPCLTTTKSSRHHFLPCTIQRSSTPSLRTSFKHLSEPSKFSSLRIRASSEEDSNSGVGEAFKDIKEKWDAIEDKSSVFLYGGGAVVAVWLSSVIVGSINSVPLLPKLMEVVGLGYTGWFVYRYLLFKSGRKELAEDIEALKKKITGSD